MANDSDKNRQLARSVSAEEIANLAEALRSLDPEVVNGAARLLRVRFLEPTIDDVWMNDELATCFVVLFINGLNDDRESEMAKTLLLWRECFAGEAARVRVVQYSPTQLFGYLSRHFECRGAPALIIADSPLFEKFIRIEEGDLLALVEKRGNFQKLLNAIHFQLLNGETLESIGKGLTKEKVFRGLSMFYREAKELSGALR